jgi:hypothetical protein
VKTGVSPSAKRIVKLGFAAAALADATTWPSGPVTMA